MAKIDLPDLYTRKDVDHARTKGETLAVLRVGGFVVYQLFSGPFKDAQPLDLPSFVPEISFPPAMNVIPQRVKDGFVALIGPLARALIRAGVNPNAITTVGTLVVVGSGVAFATGAVRLGGLLLLISGICDLLDGQVARQGGKITTFGAFYDSTLDRIGEGAVFAGLIFYFLTGPLPADLKSRAIAAGLVGLIASFLVSYTRARAEALGVENKVGIAPRAERILLLGVPALFLGAGPGRPGVVLFWIVAVLALVSAITVIQRVVHVARVARGAPPPSPIPKRETLPGVAAARRRGH